MVDTEKAAQALEDTGKEKETILAKLKELKQQEKKLTASTSGAEDVLLSDDEAPQFSGMIKQKVTSSGPINQGGGGGGGQGTTTVVVVPACIISWVVLVPGFSSKRRIHFTEYFLPGDKNLCLYSGLPDSTLRKFIHPLMYYNKCDYVP